MKGETLVAPGFCGVRSVSSADDGRIVAGENGGYGVVCWDAAGTVAWKLVLADAPTSSRYSHHVCVRVLDDTVVVGATTMDTFRVLDLATGAERSRHPAPSDMRKMELTPDRSRLVVRAGTATHVFDSRSFARLALIEAYANSRVLALSSDGLWAAVCGGSLHVIDLQKLTVTRSVAVRDSPWAGTFANEAIVLCRNVLRLYGLRDLAVLKELGSARSPIITAAATSADGSRVALVNDRGTATIYAAGTFEVERELKGHDPSVPDTFSKDIAEIVFTPAGDLVVTAPLKKQPAGITIHRLS
jgi:hypothetical protein